MMLYPILLTLVSLQCTSGQIDCIDLSATLTQKIENQGFHRNLFWHLNVLGPSYDLTNCNISMLFKVPKSLYVDPDEFAELTRSGEIDAFVDGLVDVEKPEHRSKEHDVYVFIPRTASLLYVVSFPIHLRYHRAQITGRYNRVLLLKPWILARCIDKEICGQLNRVKGICDVSGSKKCFWSNITQTEVSENVEMLVPIGNLDDYAFVSVITLLLSCSACIYILSILSETK